MEPAAAHIYRHRQASDHISGIGKSAPRPKKPEKTRKKQEETGKEQGK